MDKHVILTSEGARQFSHALDLLSLSIKEFNQVVDRMIPEKLIIDGLSSYLKDFCAILESESKLRISYISNVNFRVSDEIETTIFRCLRILILVIFKVSQPSFIQLSLKKLDNLVNLEIRYDGTQGFIRNHDIQVQQEIENVESILGACNGRLYVSPVPSENKIEIQVPL